MNAFLHIEATGRVVKFCDQDFDLPGCLGWSFPRSYIEFIKLYGYGRVCNRFLIYPPMGDFPDSFHEQTLVLKQKILATVRDDPKYAWQLEPDGSYALIQRCWPFAQSENGEILFWDVSSPDANGELPIYISGAGTGIRALPNHLAAALEAFANPKEFKKYLPFDEAPLPLQFESFGNQAWNAWLKDKDGAALN